MKNILFLEQFSNISGGQRVLLNTLAGLDRTKLSPMVAVPGRGELTRELERLKIRYVVLPIGSYSAGKKNVIDLINYIMRSLLLIPMTASLIKKEKIDLVYANAPRTFAFSAMAAKRCEVGIIWHLHSIMTGMELRTLASILKKKVDLMIAVSNSVAKPFVDIDPALKEKISVVYNGIDQAPYENAGENPTLRSELGIPDGAKLVTYIGQVVAWKGIEDLVYAAADVLKRHSSARFLIVGDVLFGNRSQLGYRDKMIKLADELNIGKWMIFAGKRTDIPEILSTTDIVVIPSIEPDPCPLVLLEAMSAGKAVVASAHGGPAELIRNGENGILYPPRDRQALDTAITDLISAPDIIKRLGENAKRTAKKELTIEKYLNAVSGLINKVLVSLSA